MVSNDRQLKRPSMDLVHAKICRRSQAAQPALGREGVNEGKIIYAKKELTCDAIVGNKKDMFHSREVSTDEGAMLARALGCDFFEASAKTNSNVEPAFKCLVKRIKLSKSGGTTPSNLMTGGRKKKQKCVVL